MKTENCNKKWGQCFENKDYLAESWRVINLHFQSRELKVIYKNVFVNLKDYALLKIITKCNTEIGLYSLQKQNSSRT